MPLPITSCRSQAADHKLIDRFDKIELPKVAPVVTRVELCAGRCQACGATTLAPLPEGPERGSPFSINIVTLALYLRFTHAISYRRLSRLMLELFGLAISEGALDAAFRRARPRLDAEVSASLARKLRAAFSPADASRRLPAAPTQSLARLRRARVVCSEETSVRVDGRTCWNWVFQNHEVVIHIIRPSRGACVVREVMAGHRPALWVSDLYSAQQGHAADWQICLAHQLRDCQFAIEAGDAIFAPRMKMLLLRAFVLARRRHHRAETTRHQYRQRLERELDSVMVLAPATPDGKRLRQRYGKVCAHLFTFLDHPEVAPDNNSSERELRPTATYRKVTGGFRSNCRPDLFAAFRSVVGTAARRGINAYLAIKMTLQGKSVLEPG